MNRYRIINTNNKEVRDCLSRTTKILATLVLCFTSICSYCMNKKDSIPIYKIENRELEHILESFINNEFKYNYFSDSAVFFINVMDFKGEILQLSSGYRKIKEEIAVYYPDSNTGIVLYKNYYFILNGRSKVNEKIFVRTEDYFKDKKIRFVNNLSDGEIDELFPTYWFINLVNGKLIVVNKSERLENK